MVRSEPKQQSGGDGAEDMVAEVMFKAGGWLIKVVALVAWWAVLFPMLSLPAAATGWVWWSFGWPVGAAALTASAVALGAWRVVWPRSFNAAVTGRMSRRWRVWSTYRSGWAEVCALHGLTSALNDGVLVPKLVKVTTGAAVDTLSIKMVSGQTVTDWVKAGDGLGHAFGALDARPRSDKPGWVLIDVHHCDTLTTPLPLPALAGTPDLGSLPVGIDEHGDPWMVRLSGRHILIAGATGAGKGSVLWSLLAAVAPAVRDGLVPCQVVHSEYC